MAVSFTSPVSKDDIDVFLQALAQAGERNSSATEEGLHNSPRVTEMRIGKVPTASSNNPWMNMRTALHGIAEGQVALKDLSVCQKEHLD